jgi:hypothetical protein
VNIIQEQVKFHNPDSNFANWQVYFQRLIDASFKFHEKNSDYFVIKYEDFIDGDIKNLENYLGFPVLSENIIEGEYGDIARIKNYGDWKNWFLREDVDFFRPLFKEYMVRYGYPDEWRLGANPKILPEHCSEYVVKITNQG